MEKQATEQGFTFIREQAVEALDQLALSAGRGLKSLARAIIAEVQACIDGKRLDRSQAQCDSIKNGVKAWLRSHAKDLRKQARDAQKALDKSKLNDMASAYDSVSAWLPQGLALAHYWGVAAPLSSAFRNKGPSWLPAYEGDGSRVDQRAETLRMCRDAEKTPSELFGYKEDLNIAAVNAGEAIERARAHVAAAIRLYRANIDGGGPAAELLDVMVKFYPTFKESEKFAGKDPALI